MLILQCFIIKIQAKHECVPDSTLKADEQLETKQKHHRDINKT